MKMHTVSRVLLGVISLATLCVHASFAENSPATNSDTPRALLLTGQNNHQWEKTTPVLE